MRPKPLSIPLILFAGSLITVSLLSVAISDRQQPLLIWNLTNSVPRGLYWLDNHPPSRGDLVVTRLPSQITKLANDRRYLPSNIPLIKPVAALSGQMICRQGAQILIDSRPVAYAQNHDSQGRALPVWSSCLRLKSSEIFLLNPDLPDSFDGRYFGPISTLLVVGRAVPLIVDKEDYKHSKQSPLRNDHHHQGGAK
jgi:conjugative transfer signal peptidase TraF